MHFKDAAKPPSALEAKSQAQALAFGPFAFHATLALRDLGLLAALDAAGEAGLDTETLAEQTAVTPYGAAVLLDFGRHCGLVTEEGERWLLGKVGYFVLHDPMTAVNFDFTRDVCYQALAFLAPSIRSGRPEGLHTLGDWPTVYEGVPHLPEPARSSWYRFDHFYSDQAFTEILPRVFDRPVNHLVDVGGNTGRWALRCLEHDPHVAITIVDLPAQLGRAQAPVDERDLLDRVSFYPADLLDEQQTLPADADVIWMSQFLDCFSAAEIVGILTRTRAVMSSATRLFIVELFPDRQAHETAAYCLDATSLYFTCVANGNSRMYRYAAFVELLAAAGLAIEEEWHQLGAGHSVFCCRREPPPAAAG